MTIGDIRAQVESTFSKIISPVNTVLNLSKIDPAYVSLLDFKPNDMGFLTNNWLRLSNKNLNFSTSASIQDRIVEGGKLYLADIIDEGNSISKKLNLVDDKLIDFLVFNVLIDVSKTPNIKEYQLNGRGSSVKVWLGEGDWDITIRGTFAGPLDWQTDTISIENLIELVNGKRNFDGGGSLYLQNPMLNRTYGINRVAVYNYSITDNPRFQTLKDFTLTLKSDTPNDIFRYLK